MEVIPWEWNAGLPCLISDIRTTEHVKFIDLNEKEVKKVL